MLRTHIQAGDEVGHASEDLIRSGKLVSDDLVNELVKERLAEPDCRAGVILDGYPRTINQARILLGFAKDLKMRAAVVHLMVDYERIVRRLSGRRQCPVCGTLYSLKTNPPRVSGVCDMDGTALVTREDDRESVIRERLAQYESQTRPILEYFRGSGVPTFEIQGASRAPEQIAKQICGSLQDAGLTDTAAAVSSTTVAP